MPDERPPTVESEAPRRPWLERVIDLVFGYDFFISYTWKDGRDYALALTRALEKQGFDCFLDSDDYRKGDDWQRIGNWTLRRTSRLVLVATPESGKSKPVLRELRIYSGLGRQIIPICFSAADHGDSRPELPPEFVPLLSSAHLLIKETLAYEVESHQVAGPAPHVAAELRDTFDLMRQDQWRTRVFGGIAAVVSCLFVATLVLGYLARLNAIESTRNARRSSSNEASSYLQLAKINARDGRWADELRWYAKAATVPAQDDPQALAAATFVGHRSRRIVNTLIHDSEIRCLEFAPDGKLLLIGDGTNQLHVWNIATGRPAAAPLPHQGPVTSLAFHPDGQLLVTGTSTSPGHAQLWDFSNRTAIGEPIEHDGPVRLVAFAADGQRFWTATNDQVRTFATDTQEAAASPLDMQALAFAPQKGAVLGRGKYPTAARWSALTQETEEPALRLPGFDFPSPDATRFLIATPFEAFEIWDASSGKLVGEIPSAIAPIFSADGSELLAYERDGSIIRAWDAKNGTAVGARIDHPSAVQSMQLSRDGRHLMTLGLDNVVRFWKPQTGAPEFAEIEVVRTSTSFLPGFTWLKRASFSPSADRVLIELLDSPAQLWDPATHRMIGEPLPHSAKLHEGRFSRNGQRFVTVGDSEANLRTDVVHVWDAETGAAVGRPLQHDGLITDVVFGPQDELLATASRDTKVRIWKVATGELLRTLDHESWVDRIVFSPDGRFIGSATSQSIRLWSTATGSVVGNSVENRAMWESDSQTMTRLHFTPDSTRFVSTGERGVLTLDTATGEPVGDPLVGSLLVMPGGDTYLLDPTAALRLWDMQSRQPVSGPLDAGGRAAISPDGASIAASSGSEYARIYTPWGEEQLPHQRTVNALAFHPRSRILLTGSLDGTAQLWDVTDGEKIGEPFRHELEVTKVSMGPEGRTLAIATGRVARVWHIQPLAMTGSPVKQEEISTSVTFGRDSSHVLLEAYGSLQVWQPDGKPPLGVPIKTTDSFARTAVAADGRVLTADGDGTVRLWEGISGKFLRQLGKYRGSDDQNFVVKAVGFSPDGRTLAIGAGNDVTVLDADSGQSRCSPLRHTAEVSCFEFTPGGEAVVIGYQDNTARLWNLRTGSQQGPALPHETPVERIRISHDGTRLVTIEKQGIRLWNRQLENLGTFEMPMGIVPRAVFSPDDRLLLLGGENGSGQQIGRLIDAQTAQPLGPELLGSARTGAGFTPNGQLYQLGGSIYSIHNHLLVARLPTYDLDRLEPYAPEAIRLASDGQSLHASGVRIAGQDAFLEFGLHPPARRDPSLLPLAVEVRTGFGWDEYGNRRLLGAVEHAQKRQQLTDAPGRASYPDVRSWHDLSPQETTEMRTPWPPFVP